MDDLRTLLNDLKDQRLDYVIARARCINDSQGIKEAGISRTTFYSWTQEERDRLNDIAQRLKRENATRALMVLQDAAEKAAKVKVAGLDSRNEYVKQNSASEILDRTVGKSAQPIDVTSKGEQIQPVTMIEIVKDHGK